MKCTIPEIAWHNRDPVLSLDVQPATNPDFYRLASGGFDTHVLIWHLKILNTGATNIEVVCDLTRHVRAVNVVRWSPSGQYLASGDDDANIIIWQQKADDLTIMLDGEDNNKENWSTFKVLRGHKDDVYDISWAPDSTKLISGSVDNTAIIWDLNRGLNDNILTDHKHYVQGVTWDPLGQYVATLSADRICRLYSETGKQLKARISKGLLPVPESHPFHGQIVRYFHDDTLKTYFRRLSFSPDGSLIITPAGYIETNTSRKIYATYIFATSSLNQNNFRPVAYLPSPGQYTIAVKCCPILFQLRPDGPEPIIELPYRMIFAVATRSSIILYDTQQTNPFGIISNIHYTRLSDMTWSSDGRLLAVSSTDGFCSLVTFEKTELGIEYVKEKEINEPEIAEALNETVEEIADVSLNISIDEKRDKKPSFLDQWTKKLKMENEEKYSKMDVDDDVQIIEPEEKENKNNVIVTKDDKIKSDQEKRKASPAKLIAVRRKPRDQMNITQFLKQPIPVASKQKGSHQVKQKENNSKPFTVSDDSLTREPWTQNKSQTSIDDSDTTNNLQPSIHDSDSTNDLQPKLLVIEDDSQDMKLVLDDTQTEIPQKMEMERTMNEFEITNKCKITNKVSDDTGSKKKDDKSVNNKRKSNSKSKCDTKTDVSKSVDQNKLTGISGKAPIITLTSPLSNKKRVPLITLSSPKHKKKPF